MALSSQEFERLKASLKEEKSRQAKPDYLSRVGSELKTSFEGLQKTTERGTELMQEGKPIQGAVMSGLGTAGGFIRGAFSPVTAALSPIIEGGLKSSGILENDKVQKTLSGLDEWAKAHPDAAENLKNVFDIAATVTGTKGVTSAVPAVKATVQTGKKAITETVGEVVDLTKRATGKIIKATEPLPPTPMKAVGQVLQGETTDVSAGVKSLSALDTTGVKTFSDLETKITSRIKELANKVDEDLSVDTTKKSMKDLVVSAKTTAGKTVKTTPVKNALDQLEELYVKTGDAVSEANIKELKQRAISEGLSNLEVNDIARVYGSEFKSKAFSKVGDPLTSVNAQMYENTRKSLKEIARQGIKGGEAKQADEIMSSLYNTKALVQKNVEAVNRLQQKISERGLLEKVGNAVSKYGDMLTGGSLRGFVGGLLPRGAGYKVLNPLDIEKALEKNLQIIQSAIKGKTDDEIVSILKKLENQSKNTAKSSITNQTTKAKNASAGESATKMRKSMSAMSAKVPPAKKSVKGITKDLEPLAVEARKYKTAEEFVKKQPLVYHGSPTELKQFNNKQGTFFTDDMMNAEGYAGGENVYEGYLNLKKPLVIDAKGKLHRELDTPYGKTTRDVVANVDKSKYDGVIFKNIKDSWIDDADADISSTIYYAFKPKDAFLNESQLTDFYNKVTKKK